MRVETTGLIFDLIYIEEQKGSALSYVLRYYKML